MTARRTPADGRAVVPGAYGLQVSGLAGAEEWMQLLPASSPCLHVEAATEMSIGSRTSRLDADGADLRLTGGGRLRMRRGDGRARFSFPEIPSEDDLLHPYLAPAAALVHLWAGREALHGGAFTTPAGAIALLAAKHGGKSTTLAWLAEHHRVPVLADDLVVVAQGAVLSGPRCLDLRLPGALGKPDLGSLRAVRKGERLRLTLPPAPAQAPLAATVVLRWGRHVTLEVATPADRLRALLPHRMYADRVAGDPPAILQLTALPMLLLTRPRGKAGLRDASRTLMDYLC